MHVTPAARSELLRFLSAGNTSALTPGQPSVRLQVVPGGCAGWSYHLDADPAPIEGDRVLPFGELELRIDPTSWPLLASLDLDYSEDLMGGSFRFANPGAAQVCSCGHSFLPTPSPRLSSSPGQYSI